MSLTVTVTGPQVTAVAFHQHSIQVGVRTLIVTSAGTVKKSGAVVSITVMVTNVVHCQHHQLQ